MKKNSGNIQEFADELKNYIDNPRIKRPKKVEEILNDSHLLVELMSNLAKEIEFLANKEINNGTFLKRFNEIEKDAEAKMARLAK